MTAEDLKKSILQQAIQGKLVPQNPNEEPASVLLERIRAEKARLVAEGKIKRDKNESVIYRNSDGQYIERIGKTEKDISEEIPFEIPASWEWVRFGILSYNYDYKRVPLSVNERSKLAKIYDYYGASGVIDKVDDFLFDRPLLLIGEDGANLINRSSPIAFIANGQYWVNNHAHVLDYLCFGLMKYVCVFINAIPLTPYVTGTAQPKMNQEKMNSILVSLPPLAEQERIVAKIEELMPMVEEYGRAQSRLDKLNSSLGDNIRKSVLQYAIQGKLVSQNPDDEPASWLLDSIREEKAILVAEGKIKRDKNESTIYRDNEGRYIERIGKNETDITDQIPFAIPDSWEWVRFNNLVSFCLGKTPERADSSMWSDTDFPWVSIADMKDGETLTKTKEFISNKALSNKFNNFFSPIGTLIMSFKLTIGKVSVLGIDAVHNEAIISIFPYINKGNITRNYLFKVLPLITNYASSVDAIKGATLNSKTLAQMFIPVPPLAEQKRIVERINQILSLYN